jgi:endonuclease YncB( thermonuclease family)
MSRRLSADPMWVRATVAIVATGKIGIAAATLVLGLMLCGPVTNAETGQAESSLVGDVGRIVDGDTLELIVGSRKARIRLAEIE